MSEQEKNTTPAQNAAPAAPKPPKIDNAALKKAAAALREENNPQNFNAVINLMMRGVFLAPAKIEIGENAPKPDENGRIQLPKDTKVTFALLKSGDGKSFFTAFTDAEELDKWQNKPAGQVMLLRFDDYARMLNGNDHVAGFVLNPFTDNLRFNSDMVASLLKQRNAMLEKIKQTAAQQAEAAQRELQKAEYELQVAKDQQRKAADEVLTLQGRQDHYDLLLESLRLSCETMEQELSGLDRRETDGRGRMAGIQADITAAEDRAAALRQEMRDKLAGQTDLTEQTNQLAQAVSDKKADQAALSAEKDSVLRSVEDLRGLQADMVSDRAERDRRVQEYRQANEKALADMAGHQAALEEKNARVIQLRQRLEDLAQAKLALEQQRDQNGRDSRACNDTLLQTMQAYNKLQQKLENSGMEESQILEKLWERYELSHSDAMEQRIELESVPKATRRIAELNREIKGLGTPNIGAIEEFDRVNTRYTYLSEQRSDVEQAKEELLGIIDQITQQMTSIFAEQFQLLNESFQETFLELFGGGKARLELEDESDILNCGIEIKVQPPGKQLKTITLLSGGEKAFVAIALYFAILKVHPTPFCVMDEIEAALDEANVVRYARYMRRIAGKTQFIVITHRRGTMEEADVLYGVTMQEKGVSRILTINLNDMAKELHIK